MTMSRKIKVRITQLNIETPPPVGHSRGRWFPELHYIRPRDIGSVNFRGVVEYIDFHRIDELQDMMHRGEVYLTDDKPVEWIPPKKTPASIMRFLK